MLHGASAQHVSAPVRVSLSAWPSRVEVNAGGRRVIRIQSAGRRTLRVEARVAGYALDLHGRPRIAGAAAATFVTVRPQRIKVGRVGASLMITTRRPRGFRPGDYSALVLLTAVAPSARRLLVRIRIGLVVTVRVPGALFHRVAVRAVHVRRFARRRLIELTVANTGNVIELIDAARLRFTLIRRGRVVARLRPVSRRLLPRTSGLIALRYAGPLRGRMRARVDLRQPGGPSRARSFPLRL
jgi:hypothetical protein